MSDFNGLLLDFRQSLKNYSFENGMISPAGLIVKQLVDKYEIEFLKYLMILLSQEKDIQLIADTINCISHVVDPSWSKILLQKAISHPSVIIRDAVVQSIDDQDDIEILRNHKEEVPWLKSYIESIIRHRDKRDK
jgi:hypothetical protein